MMARKKKFGTSKSQQVVTQLTKKELLLGDLDKLLHTGYLFDEDKDVAISILSQYRTGVPITHQQYRYVAQIADRSNRVKNRIAAT